VEVFKALILGLRQSPSYLIPIDDYLQSLTFKEHKVVQNSLNFVQRIETLPCTDQGGTFL